MDESDIEVEQTVSVIPRADPRHDQLAQEQLSVLRRLIDGPSAPEERPILCEIYPA